MHRRTLQRILAKRSRAKRVSFLHGFLIARGFSWARLNLVYPRRDQRFSVLRSASKPASSIAGPVMFGDVEKLRLGFRSVRHSMVPSARPSPCMPRHKSSHRTDDFCNISLNAATASMILRASAFVVHQFTIGRQPARSVIAANRSAATLRS